MRLIIFLLKCVVGLFASIGFLIAMGVFAAGVMLSQVEPWRWEPRVGEVPDASVLVLDLGAGLIETRPDNPLASFSLGDTLILQDALAALQAAKTDSRVKGLVAHLGRGELGVANTQELREAIRDFQESGKFTIAFSESFGEGGNGTLHYYLASGFESVWLQPSGDMDITGVSLQSPFLREALDELGIEPRFDQREDYKGAASMFTDTSFPVKQRQNLQQLVDAWIGQIAGGIAENRGLSADQVRALIDRAPLLASEAHDQKLVDELGYWDQVEDEIESRAGEGSFYISLATYEAWREKPGAEGPVIAIVHGLGPVMLSRSENDPVFGRVVMGSDTVSTALADAIADEEVRAIIFRVDSPGGSYVASDTIWREMQRAREQSVPVIVSMGNVAASGGYFVAAPAHKIVAQPGTITGSIGVVAGKLVMTGLWEQLGIGWDGVQAGTNANIWSMNDDFTPEGWARLQDILDKVYDDFTAKVADGRGLSRDQTLKAAQGQVWSGADALELGLVDALGGYTEAIALAREAAEIGPEAPIQFRHFPGLRDPLDALIEDTLGSAAASPSLHALTRGFVRLARAITPLVTSLERLTADPRSQRLMAPELLPSN